MFGSKKAKLRVTGRSCEHCEQALVKGLAGMTGVVKVKADHTKERITIQYRGECPSLDKIKTRVEDLGFETGSVWV